jgi:hypothetical protein
MDYMQFSDALAADINLTNPDPDPNDVNCGEAFWLGVADQITRHSSAGSGLAGALVGPTRDRKAVLPQETFHRKASLEARQLLKKLVHAEEA